MPSGKLPDCDSYRSPGAALPFQTARYYGLRAIGSGLQMVR